MRCTHFVGFKGEEYISAVRAFGRPDFVHRGWDLRARREIADGDLIIFAQGGPVQEPRVKSYDDIREAAWRDRGT
jgi:ASC-1-like (ASCH) protein